MPNRSVVHLTSVHPRYDTRIFLKECCSLADAGYAVSLVVADGKGDEVVEGINIFDVGSTCGRFDRIRNTTQRVFQKTVELDADIYHLHDPELTPAGLKLKKRGKCVVFDAHEDVPKQVMGKPYLNRPLLWTIAKTFAAYEKWACKKFDAIVAATPFIRDKFLDINPNTIDVNNFPMLDELSSISSDWSQRSDEVCYVGAIGPVRGIREMVKAVELVESGVRLQLGGKFSAESVESEVKSYSGWQHVDELGWLDREGVKSVLSRSIAGLVTLRPIINYIDALPVKMFEYMCSGLPVIASNFPLWREIVEGNECGLCVDPLNPTEIAKAIDFLVNNPDRAEQMGKNGQQAVNERYNWAIEEKKLLELYSRL